MNSRETPATIFEEEVPKSFLASLTEKTEVKHELPRLLRVIELPDQDSTEYHRLEEKILLKQIAPFFMDEPKNKGKKNENNENRYHDYFKMISQKLKEFPNQEEAQLNLSAEILDLMKAYEEALNQEDDSRNFGPNNLFKADSYEENPENVLRAKMCSHILTNIIKQAEEEQGENKSYEKILFEEIGRVTLRKIEN